MGERFLPGDETWYGSDAPVGDNSVVFEDDGDTGYFYAVERCGEDLKILDAVQIYAVRNVVDREIPSELDVVWTPGGQQAALYLNGYPHAVFDFNARRGYCRTGFPPPPQTGSEQPGTRLGRRGPGAFPPARRLSRACLAYPTVGIFRAIRHRRRWVCTLPLRPR